jgi:outer membrane protein, heavy metal efflux system
MRLCKKSFRLFAKGMQFGIPLCRGIPIVVPNMSSSERSARLMIQPPQQYAYSIARRLVTLSVIMLLGACATYKPQPLPQGPDLETQVPRLKIDVQRLPLPVLRSHPFNPENGLDMTEVAILAVINNPELKASRRQAEVARAQLFNARLLPDPQISVSGGYPTSGPSPLTDAYGFGLNYDLMALVLRDVTIATSRAAARQVDLEILWEEWQIVQQARTFFVQSILEARKLALLSQAQALYARRYARSFKALEQGNLTLDVAGTDLTALLDANTRISQMEQDLNKTRHDFNMLLGLRPDVELNLTPLPEPQPLEQAAMREALAGLPKRRPDLLALQAAYQSQEAKVRSAVLSQFPSLSIGINQGRDTGDVTSIGLGITLNLPILNGNRGQIAIQRATRAQLGQAYQARMDQAYNEVNLLETQQDLIARQLAVLREKLPILQGMVEKATLAYDAGNIGSLIYVNMANTLLNKRLEAVNMEQSLWEIRIALDTLLAWPGEASASTAGEGRP